MIKGTIIAGIIVVVAFVIWQRLKKESEEVLSYEASPSFEDLLDAIEWVESRGEARMMGDAEPIMLERKVGAKVEVNYRAIGAYQLHKIYVDDVNRILKGWKQQIGDQVKEAGGKGLGGWFVPYTYNDRWNRILSRDMTRIYLTYYTPLNNNYDKDLEKAARIHNGGPRGYKKESTKPYWEKIKARMNEHQSQRQ